jgi:hypothetical protein
MFEPLNVIKPKDAQMPIIKKPNAKPKDPQMPILKKNE